MSRLFTADPKALNHILMNSYTYQKPEATRYNLSQILGAGKPVRVSHLVLFLYIHFLGVLVVEEDKHKQQVCFI